MDLSQITRGLLKGGLTFTSLVIVALILIAFASYFSVGMGMNNRRTGGVIAILVLIAGGALAVMILFPDFLPAVQGWLATLH